MSGKIDIRGVLCDSFRARSFLLVTVTVLLVFAVTYARPVGADGSDQGGEVWVTLQASSSIKILHPRAVLNGAAFETINLPSGAHPHITTFSPDGKFAYVANMGNGDLVVIRAEDRQIVSTLNLGLAGTHQAKPSPDGTMLLAAQIPAKTLFKIAVDEASESWTVVGSLSLANISVAPVCTVFRDDGLRAYVSLNPSGIAIVDVPTMTVLGVLPTDGFIACGMIKSHDGRTIFIASKGSGGHLYQLDTTTDTLVDTQETIGAGDWHSFNISPDEKTGFGTSPGVDQLQIIDLATGTSSPFELNPTPGVGNDQPDAIAVQGSTVYVTLRMAGKLAVLDTQQLTVAYIDLAPPATSVNPANCMGCAIHGVVIRPDPSLTTTSPGTVVQSGSLSFKGRVVERIEVTSLWQFVGIQGSLSVHDSCGCCGCCGC
jgi:DNA-binding beta-propeller fold protein YncE